MRDSEYFISQLKPQFLLEFSNYAPIGEIKPIFLALIQSYYIHQGIKKALWCYQYAVKSLESRGHTIFIDD